MNAKQRAEWSRALGRRPNAQKDEFIDRAAAYLENMEKIQALQADKPNADEQNSVLNEIVDRAESLARALARAEQLQVLQAYYLPRLPGTLRALAEAARSGLPRDEPRPAHRPRNDGSAAIAIVGLTAVYREVFETEPGFGNNSPFVKFVRAAFPDYGFAAPSAQKVRDPFGNR
jgi:hypothetical protein